MIMKKPKHPTKAEATAIIYGKIIETFSASCFEAGIIATINYVPTDADQGTLNLAIQHKASELFVSQHIQAVELLLSDYLNYCNELNNTYEAFGFNELTIA